MKYARKVKPQHRRAWWRLWRYCRCGHRWICPDSILLVPGPYHPSVPPLTQRDCWSSPRETPLELTEAERAEILALSDAPPPSRPRANNRRPRRDAPTRSHPDNGRAGTLTPAQRHHSRLDTRV